VQSARVRLQIVRGRSVALPVARVFRGRYLEVLCKLRQRGFEIDAAAMQPLVGLELDRDRVALPHGELHRIMKHHAKAIPISRPQVVVEEQGGRNKTFVLFRDAERQSRVSVAVCDDLGPGDWRIQDLTTQSVGRWEPSYDTELWGSAKVLDIFLERVGQGDAETSQNVPPQIISILEWKPK
jgi:hypothetical protein